MLPVLDIENQITAALRSTRRLVLTAPTGSGKTTQIPQILLRSGLIEGQIIVLQPRRLATRMVAHRVAQELGSPLGQLVGYQTRHDSRISPQSRIRFMTEGLFLRLIQSDPALGAAGAVVLDEFHERSVSADVSLGLMRRLQESGRGDLKLIVMSATLDASAVAAYLDCPALTAGGRLYPIDIRYLPRRSGLSPWDLAAQALCPALDESPDGDVLIFMPGAYEIGRTIDACRRAVCGSAQRLHFFPLHGSLPAAQQDAAAAPSAFRKVIVATNVAQTSITLSGVRCVIDSGLARIHHYDGQRGINVLRVEPISRAAADQRAGRAGRTGPGLCLRLWTEADHHQVHPERDEPEIHRIELSEPILQLRAMGIEDVSHFPWLDPPPAAAVERGRELLESLGAVDKSGRLAQLGQRMAGIPVHPRLSRMLLEAQERRCLLRAARWAAIIAERDLVLRSADLSRFVDPTEPASDLAVRERALQAAQAARFDPARCQALGVHAHTARQVEQTARLLLDACKRLELSAAETGTTADLIRCVLAGYGDHLAVRREPDRPHCTLPGRRRVVLDPATTVRSASLLLPVELHEIGRGENVELVLSLVSEVDPQWLDPSRITIRKRTAWNAANQSVEQIEERLYGDLVIDATSRPQADPQRAAEMLVERIAAGELALERWDEAVTQWIERVRCAGQWFPQRRLIGYDADEVRIVLHEIVGGATRVSQVAGRPCLDAVRGVLSWEDQQFVERVAPASIQLPGGYRMKLMYDSAGGGSVRGRAKIQDLYGLTETPRIADGRRPVLLEILAPNFRPIQLTADLPNFWKNLYPQLRSELRRRYPRHEWR